MQLPDALDDELREILSMGPRVKATIAHALRQDGMEIQPSPADESAIVLHWLLTLYAQRGVIWRLVAAQRLDAIVKRLSIVT